MTTETIAADAAAGAVGAAVVAGDVAAGAVDDATRAADAARAAEEAARSAEETARNAEAQAALDAQQRINDFERNLSECQAQIAALRTELVDGLQSISTRLTVLTMLEELDLSAIPRRTIAAAGNTSDSAAGVGQTVQSNGEPASQRNPADADQGAPASSTAKEQGRTPAKVRERNWL